VSRWPTSPISAVCSLNPRRDVPPSQDILVGFVPMAAVDQGDGSITVIEPRPYAAVVKGFTQFRPRDVIFAKITPCMENGKAALVGEMPNGMGFGSTEFHVLRAGERILPELVHAWVRRAEFRADAKATFKGTAGQQRVPIDFFERALIPVPPLHDQRRIVDLLGRAAGIRRLREAALAKARETIPALFLSMFGDPATNPMRWPIRQLGELVSIGASLELPSIERNPTMPCFGPEAIEAGTGAILARTTVAEAAPRSAKFRYRPGDVLYSKIRPYLAKVMLAEDEGFISADMYPLSCTTALEPAFLWRLLLTGVFTRWAVSQSSRAQMPKLNRETLFSYDAPVPPISLQKSFADRAADLRSIITQQERALAIARDTERALMARLLG
jgi:type I restriction enzyme S subunit